MNFIQELYANPVVHSIGWALLHACWQITLLALLLKFVLKSAEKYSSNLAYSFAVISLITICLWSGYTFAEQYQHFDQAIKLAPLEAKINTESQITIATKNNRYFTNTNLEQTPLNWEDRLYQFERYLPILVILWLMGTLFLILRFIGAWLQVRRLKTKALSPVEAFWLERLQKLKLKIGVQKNVQFFKSALVNEPVTMGHFKPIILVPLGMFSNLTPNMVEALLLHELAHIKRSDYLVNIIQSLLEIIFFFHPGIWWISKNIRQIREHACDDMAVNACQDPLLYAKTLTHIQSSFLSSKNILAMSATGTSGNFTTRIKRLFGYSESTPRSKRSLAFSSLIFTGLLLFAFTNPLEKTVNTGGFPEQITPSEAMLFVITPSTTQEQLDKIKAAFAEQNVIAEFTGLSYSPFGLLESIRADFRLANKVSSMMHIEKLIHLTISLDWNRERPLDLRGSGDNQSIVLPSEGHPISDCTYPYINTFDKPSMIGKLGFKKDKNNKAVLTADSPNDKTRFFLNGESILKDQLNAKKLEPEEVHSMHRLAADQFKKKYNETSPEAAYEIFTKDKKKKKGWWPFEKDTDPDVQLTQHTFKVLHKAEIRELNEKPGILGTAGGPISISSNSCNDDKKAYHVLNDQYLEVPEGHCYPPAIRALAEVDSFFMLDEKLSLKLYNTKSAYLYYYNYNKEETSLLASETELENELINDQKISKLHASESEWPESGINKEDILIMRQVTFNMTCDLNAPLCFLNDKKLDQTKAGMWPDEILAIPQFDSLVLITGETALAKYGEAGKNDVWLFYKNSDAKFVFPKLLKSNKDQVTSNMIYVVDNQIIFPEANESTPAFVEALDPDKILGVKHLFKYLAVKKYSSIGENGVIEITTNANNQRASLADEFKVSPNPIHESAKVEFVLLDQKQVNLMIYDQWGTQVATVVDRKMNKGMHEFRWEPGDLPSGIYYVHLRVEGDKPYTKSVVLQKGL